MVGEYLKPTGRPVYPRRLSLPGFLQTVLVGLSGLDGTLVREKAQVNPPKSPALETNWLTFEVNTSQPDASPYFAVQADGTTQMQRHSLLTLACSFYGPDALSISDLVRDGFEIGQNRYWLNLASMGFAEMTQAMRMPDLVHERWVNRYERSITLRHQLLRSYPIPTILSASGQLHTVVGDEDYLQAWATPLT